MVYTCSMGEHVYAAIKGALQKGMMEHCHAWCTQGSWLTLSQELCNSSLVGNLMRRVAGWWLSKSVDV